MFGILETVSTKAKIIQTFYWRNETCVERLIFSLTKVLQLCFQSHITLSTLITRKLSFRWNLADNATGLNKFNWRGKNLLAANNQPRSQGPELGIYESGSPPVREILRSTLTKTIACDQLVPWIQFTIQRRRPNSILITIQVWLSSTAAKLSFAYHPRLISIHGCHISTRVSFTFDFHPRLQIPISPSSN